jgi:hypothetical protein
MPSSRAARSDKRGADIDELYSLPLDRFTAARDELARRLRKAGDRAASEDVKRLRKPSVAAWALNQVRRREPRRVDELIAAGDRLRDAQRQLQAGGERGLLRQSTAEERALVQELVGLGERELVDVGHSVTGTLRDKLRQTLHAVARDPEIREQLSSGRLVSDRQVSDFGLVAGDTGSVPGPGRRSAPAPGAKASQDAAISRKVRTVRRAIEKARRRESQLDEKFGELQRRAEDARIQARQAAERVAELEADLQQLESD